MKRRLSSSLIGNWSLQLASFIILSLFSLRSVLLEPGVLGFGWDWGVPPLAEQMHRELEQRFFAWNPTSLGQENVVPIDTAFLAVLSLLSLLGGEIATKGTLAGLQVLSAVTMSYLCGVLSIRKFAATCSAWLYMLSPFVYSRMVAGHLQFLFGYSLLPLLTALLFSSYRSRRFNIPRATVIGLVFTLTSQSHVFLGLASLMLVLVSGAFLFARHTGLRKVASTIVTTFLVFVSLNAFWIVAFLSNYSVITSSYLARTSGIEYAKWASPYPIDSLRLLGSSQGLGTEIVFPVETWLFPIWFFVSLLLPLISFSETLVEPKNPKVVFFALVSIIGLTLVSAGKSVLGNAILPALALTGPFFGAFDNLNRFAPLVIMSYAALLGHYAQRSTPNLLSEIGRRFSLGPFRAIRDLSFSLSKLRYTGWATLFLILILSIYPLPFFSNQLATRPSFAPQDQPYKVIVTPLDPEYVRIYNFLRDKGDAYRIGYLPSPYAGYPSKYWMDNRSFFHVTTRYLPAPDLFTPISDPFVQFLTISLYNSPPLTQDIGKILGLASVRYVMYTDVKSTSYFPRINPDVLGEVIRQQNDLTEVMSAGDPLTYIYENQNYLPLARPISSLLLADGDYSSMLSLSSYPSFDFESTGLVLSPDLDSSDYAALPDSTTRSVLIYNNRILDLLVQALGQYLIYPGNALAGSDPQKEWTNLQPYWYYDSHYAARLDRNRGAVTLSEALLDIPLNVPERGNYEIYALAHVGPRGSKLNATIDNFRLGVIQTFDLVDLGFLWTKVGTLALEPGPHTLTFRSAPGENALLKVAFLPPDALAAESATLSSYKSVVVDEAEIFGRGVPVFDASLGSAMLLLSGNIMTDDFDEWENSTKPLYWTSSNYSLLNRAEGSSGYALEVLPNGSTFRSLSNLRISSLGLQLNFTIQLPSLEDPNSPDNWAALIVQFDDGSLLFYGAGGPLTQYTTPSQKIVMVANGTTSGEMQVTRDIQADVEREFGMTSKTITGVYLAAHTVRAYFDSITLEKVKADQLRTSLYVPQDGLYTLQVRARSWSDSTNARLRLGIGESVTELEVHDNFGWNLLDSVSLKQGEVDLWFSASGTSGVLVDLLVLSDSQSDIDSEHTNLAQITSFERSNPSEYLVEGQSQSPFIIAFAQGFDSRWQGKLSNSELRKWPLSGFGMMFFVPFSGPFSLRISFTPQELYSVGHTIGVQLLVLLFALNMVTLAAPRILAHARRQGLRKPLAD